jgi:hypothetical protein
MMSKSAEILDLAGEAIRVLEDNAALSAEAQLDAWRKHYYSEAPDLLRKCIESYESEGCDWRQIALEHVWLHLLDGIDKMQVARRSVRHVAESVYTRSKSGLGLDFPVLFVVYVGIGCGAGWATTFRDKPAVLVGLENVAELGWQEPPEMRKLLAHEIGHLFMSELRQGRTMPSNDSLCELFEEGFAQHAEHLIFGEESWGCSSQQGWLEWCAKNEGCLARRFLAERGDEEEIRKFFGSWFDIDGWRQTGYFLGCRLVAGLAHGRTMAELAALSVSEIRDAAEGYLESVR